METYWHVILTPCFPRQWKVESIKFPGANNDVAEYFEHYSDALVECDRRNKRDQDALLRKAWEDIYENLDKHNVFKQKELPKEEPPPPLRSKGANESVVDYLFSDNSKPEPMRDSNSGVTKHKVEVVSAFDEVMADADVTTFRENFKKAARILEGFYVDIFDSDTGQRERAVLVRRLHNRQDSWVDVELANCNIWSLYLDDVFGDGIEGRIFDDLPHVRSVTRL